MITNYSMLEFLLLKPETQKIFSNPWQYIVLDEAHCYTGGLGTELAWLLRRVKRRLNNPPGLRMIATSATLLNDNNLSVQESKDLIIKNFCQKLFKSSAQYEVIFGSYADGYISSAKRKSAKKINYTSVIDKPIEIGDFIDLCTEHKSHYTLMQATQELLGLEGRIKKIQKIISFIEDGLKNNGSYSLGHLLAIWETLQALKNSKHFSLASQDDFTIDDTVANQKVIVWLLEYCEKMVGPYNEDNIETRNAWRDYLHDATDSTESDDGQRKGNRLNLLKKFRLLNTSRQLNSIDHEQLFWLTKIAFIFDQQTPTRLGVLSCSLTCSPSGKALLQTFCQEFATLLNKSTAFRSFVADEWKKALGIFVDSGKFEFAIADYFEDNIHLASLLKYFKEHQEDKEKNSNGLFPQQFSVAAEEIFKQKFDDSVSKEFDSFIQLASLGELEQYRKPLLTIRYHQLLSGVNCVGVTYKKQNDSIDFSLIAGTAEQTDDKRQIFTLGLCPDCGQPYILGYLENPVIPKGKTVSLSRTRGKNSLFLHAFSIHKCTELPGATPDFKSIRFAPAIEEVDCNLYLDLTNGTLADTPVNMFEPVQVIWHIPPRVDLNESQFAEFISFCPRCKSSRNRRRNEHYGAIIPYAAYRRQLRLVALDHLLYMTAPSKDPVIAYYSGNGRKVLTFSDSRNAAAQMAYQYQDYSRKRILVYLISFAMQDLKQLELQEDLDFLEDLFNIYWDDSERFLSDHVNKPRNLLLVAGSLLIQSRKRNASRLFDISLPGPINDHDESKSTVYLLLQTIRESEKQSILSNNIIELKSKSLEAFDYEKLSNALTRIGCKSVPKKDKLKELCYDIYFYLLRNCKLSLAKYGFEWIENVFLDHNEMELPVCSQEKIIRSNTIKNKAETVFSASSKQDIQIILQIIWTTVFQPAVSSFKRSLFSTSTSSTIIDNRSQGINLLDLYFEMGDMVTADQEVKPFEKELNFILREGNIPARVEEHTAQIEKNIAASYQNAFSDGLINILSCSTTFEMGVDLGELGSVFLGNMPPSVANYRQRAGRAGRRPGMPAYVLTFIGDGSHDQYYKEHAPELLFGDVICPSIYLDNPVFRARHLRSEAFHDFLMNYAGKRVEMTAKNMTKELKELRWDQISDFFIGGRASRKKIISIFTPLVDQMQHWYDNEKITEHLQNYIRTIDDVEDIDYSVAADFCWQILDQENAGVANCIAPYKLIANEQTLDKYRNLGGHHRPVLQDGKISLELKNIHRSSLQRKLKQIALAYNNENTILDFDGTLDGAASRLFYDSVITWFARNRILPKYGFPVDVTQLLIENDVALNLERDMRIGLFEYSPGQKLIADKRLYESTKAIAWKKGIHNPEHILHDTYYVTFYECPFCQDLSLQDSPCPQGHPRRPRTVFKPDGFVGRRVFTSEKLSHGYVPRVQLYTGGIRKDSEIYLPGSILRIAESDTDTLQYINKGSDYNNSGFEIDRVRCWLLHDVCTDIALWLFPESKEFDMPAMESALSAILSAISFVLKIEPRDIGGTIQSFQNGHAFVLFDASTGGGGIVQDLILHSNDEQIIAQRVKLINQILNKAIEICKNCPECEKTMSFKEDGSHMLTGKEFNQKYGEPLAKYEYAGLSSAAMKKKRIRQACYHCLCSYQNQNKHELLDRAQAVILLEKLLPKGQK